MKILIVSATEFEIAPYLVDNRIADVLITGVGAPACMYALTKKLQTTTFDFVIQAGIAGTFKNAFPLGETFIVKQDVFADVGIFEKGNFKTLFDAGFADKNKAPYVNGWLLNETIKENTILLANSITVNTVSDSDATIDLYKNKFDADIESMEGAAFHYVCINEGIPFLQIRSISNFVGERIKTNWKMNEAIKSLNVNLKMIVEGLVGLEV